MPVGGISIGSLLGLHWHQTEGGHLLHWAGVGALSYSIVFIITAVGVASLLLVCWSQWGLLWHHPSGEGWISLLLQGGSEGPGSPNDLHWCHEVEDSVLVGGDESPASYLFSDITLVRMFGCYYSPGRMRVGSLLCHCCGVTIFPVLFAWSTAITA